MVYTRKRNDDVLAHGDSDSETDTCFGTTFQWNNKLKPEGWQINVISK